MVDVGPNPYQPPLSYLWANFAYQHEPVATDGSC